MAVFAGMKRLGTGAAAACVLALGAASAAQAADPAAAPPAPSLDAIGAGEFTFAPTAVGETSAPRTFTFKALKDVKAPGIDAVRLDSDQFKLVEEDCTGAELVAADGDTCSVTVAYAPTAATADSADLKVVVGPGDEEAVLLHGAIKTPEPVVVPAPAPVEPAPVLAAAAPLLAAVAPAAPAPVVVAKPAKVVKTASCAKTSSKKVVCTVKMGLAKTTKVKASLMKGRHVLASSTRKGDGKVTLKSAKKLKAKSYSVKFVVGGKTAMRASVKLG